MNRSNMLASWFKRTSCGALALGIVAGTAWSQNDQPATETLASAAAKEAAKRANAAAEEARNRAAAAAEKAKQQGAAVRDAAQDAAAGAREKAEGIRERAGKIAANARQQGRDTGERAGAFAKEVREHRTEFHRQNFRSADMGLWFDRKAKDGLVISDVGTTGTIAKLGFHEGDRILSVNGQKVAAEAEFIERLFADNVRNQRVEVVVMRDGSNQTIYVEPATFVDEYEKATHDPLDEFGVILDDRQNDAALILKVLPRSPAFYAGVRKGDVVTTFHDQPVATVADFVQAIRNRESGAVNVEVNRGGKTREFEVDMHRLAAFWDRREPIREERSERREEAREERGQNREERSEDREERREARDDDRQSPRSSSETKPEGRVEKERNGILPRNK